MTRTIPVIIAASLSLAAHADRIVNIPTGKKIPKGTVRAEFLTTPGKDFTFGWFSYAPDKFFEIEYVGENLNKSSLSNSFNLQYTYIVPITDLSPGISFGILDGLDETSTRRTLYTAITYRLGNDGPNNQDYGTDLTFGFWTKKEGIFFIGAEIPFSKQIWLVGEHDSVRATAGLDLRLFDNAGFRILFRNGEPTFGLRIQKSF